MALAGSGVTGAVESQSSGGNARSENATGGIDVDYYGATLPGSVSNPDPLEYSYRSTRPFRMKSNVGGVGVSRPQGDGVKLGLNLTEDDAFGGSLVNIGRWNVAEVSEIRFDATGPINILLPLGIAFNGGTIGEWESVGGNMERGQSLDGDGRALAFGLSPDDSPIDRTDRIFTIPGPGTIGPRRNASIQDLQDEYGTFPMRVNASIIIGRNRDSLSKETLVKELSVVTRETA